MRIPNRTVRWADDGVEYEPDQRHADLIIKHMQLTNSKIVSNPGIAEVDLGAAGHERSEMLTGTEATLYRALAARLNYLAMDRPDVQFVAKEVSKYMSQPKKIDWTKFTRVAKYLLGKPRYIQEFRSQHEPDRVLVFTDSDWAGDRASRSRLRAEQ